MIALKDLYKMLPIFGQTLAINAISSWNRQLKYGGSFKRYLEQLEYHETCSLDQLLTLQQQALQQILEYANTHIPYYRRLGCSSTDFSTWPILDKHAVAAHPQDFLSDEITSRDFMALQTSGTTGAPLTVHITRDYHKMEMAFRWRHKAWGGVPYLTPSAYFSGHPVVPADQTRPPFWRMDRFERRLLCSSYHLSQQNLPFYIQAISDYKPGFIHGYPSSLYMVSQFLLQNGIRPPSPQAIFTASETLLDFQRTTIEKAFSTKVFNWYGNTEMTCNIVQCVEGNLHYRTDYGVLELLEDGTMICTGLNNRAMPFIRYKVGDRAAWGELGSCACGCQFPLVKNIEGRVEDCVITPDGRQIGRLDHLFKERTAIREAQIVQHTTDEITLRIVRNGAFSQKDVAAILAEARHRLGSSMDIRFEYVETIERTANGKFRFIVSTLTQPPVPCKTD